MDACAFLPRAGVLRGVEFKSMTTNKWNTALALSMVVCVALACNFSATTANISSLKLSKDRSGSPEASSYAPGDTIYAVATVSNSMSAVKVRGRVLFVDVQGQQANSQVPDLQTEVSLPSSGTATFHFAVSGTGWPNGRYRVETTMLNESGQQIDQKTAEFTVTGGRSGAPPAGAPPPSGSGDGSEPPADNSNN